MVLGERFARAVEVAAELHGSQVRKGTKVPYLAHLLGTAAIALEHGADEEQAIAAVLHDAPEDCGGLPVLERIRAEFGERVARIVEGCSDCLVPKGTKKAPWRERKERYIAHLALAPAETKLVSTADKIHNARAILSDLKDPAVGSAVWGRFRAGREEQLWYYVTLARVLRGTPGAAELAAVVSEIRTLA